MIAKLHFFVFVLLFFWSKSLEDQIENHIRIHLSKATNEICTCKVMTAAAAHLSHIKLENLKLFINGCFIMFYQIVKKFNFVNF